MRQEDFWDSVNLINGEYKPSKSFKDGLMDFLGQLKKDDSATMSAPELPVSDLSSFPFTAYALRHSLS